MGASTQKNSRVRPNPAIQGCQIYLGAAYKIGKMHQMIAKCTKKGQKYTK
jgi:hypothetical protein